MNTESSPALTLRADLVRRRIQMGRQLYWVLKDPLSRAFFYFSDREFAILQLLDGRRRLPEVTQECIRRFAPDYISPESLIRFLSDAKRNGIITIVGGDGQAGDAEGPGQLGRRKRSLLNNPLAFRLPGLNPDRLLDRFVPLLRPLFTPLAAATWIMLMLVAVVIAITQFSLLAEHVTAAAMRTSGTWWLTVMIVIVATKIIHELAHAITCKAFGAECRELGVMLLVGVPCLYCDVSDAWMLPERWKRMLVSAAGMMAELGLAAVAVLIWTVTNQGDIRDLCVTVIVVCSISTVLFNGNPLLRYDGYFILSDFVGVPNLAGESTALIRGWFRRHVWALPKTAPPSSVSNRGNAFLVTYGLLSGVYRAVVLVVIATIVYQILGMIGLGWLGGLLAIVLIVGMTWRMTKPILQPPDRSIRRSALGSSRRMVFLVATACLLVLVLLTPLPRHVVAPMSVRPANAASIFLETSGVLTDAVQPGTELQQDDVVAQLKSWTLEREQRRHTAEQQRLQTLLDSLKQRRVSQPQAAAEIPAIEQMLAAAVDRRKLASRESEKLTLRATIAGKFYSPANVLPASDPHTVATWSSTPLDPINRGVYLEQGTMLGTIGDPHKREALVLVRQQDVELIQVDQAASILLATEPRHTVTGRVVEVAVSPVENIPRELLTNGLIEPASISLTDPNGNTFYQVRVAIDQPMSRLPIESTANIRIRVRSASVLSRVVRYARDTFRF